MIRKLLVLFALVLSGCASSDAGNVESVRRELETLYQSLAEASARRDIEAVVSMWSEDFALIDDDSTPIPASEVRVGWQEMFDTSLDPLHFRYTIQALELRDGEAVATIHREFSWMNAIDGELRRVDTTAVQKETWVKTGQGWKLRRISEVRPGRRLVDGAPSERS
jgi:ketosteroid isomerase-like protein